MVWRRTVDFIRPQTVYCSLINAKDPHLQALQIFFESPQCAGIPAVYLTCFGHPLFTSTSTLLARIKSSGCQKLCYSARCAPLLNIASFPPSPRATPSRLEYFSSSGNTIFSPSIISFTISMLRNSPLKELFLRDTGLSPTMWRGLLQSLDLPLLQHLEVDQECSLINLTKFLQRHHRIESLFISGESEKTRSSSQLFAHSIHLPSLHTVGGPAEYLTPLLRQLRCPGSVTSLSVTLSNTKPRISLISKVLDCAQYLPGLREAKIYFLSKSVSKTGLLFPKTEARTCGAMRLRISASFDTATDGDEEILVR